MSRIKGGYILVARSTLGCELMDKPPLYTKLWLWMLLKANHQSGKGNLERGQLVASLQDLIKAGGYRIGYRREHPTKKQVRAVMDWFRSEGMITARKCGRGMIITIVNYDLYQNPESYKDGISRGTRKSDEGHNEGHNERHNEGHSETSANPESKDDTGHGEGHAKGTTKGAIGAHQRQEGEEGRRKKEEKNREKIFPGTSSRAELLNRFENQNVRSLVEEVLEKIALTRKSGRVAESVITGLLKKLHAFEPWKVGTGISKYLQGEYYLDGKDERYLLGIVRNVTARDYQEVIQQEAYTDVSPHSMQPTTYAQAQDAERRAMAQKILQRRSSDEQEGNDSGGTDQAGHSLPGGKTQHG
jgi:hypothetical protein